MDRPVDYLHHITSGSDRLASACEAARGVRVPTCPDWTIEQLAAHIGRIHRWVTAVVASSSMEAVAKPNLPPDDTDWPQWLRDGAAALVETLGHGDPDAPVWNPIGQPPTRRFWARRQAQETSVHAWDADNAAAAAGSSGWSGPVPLDPELAADGIDEVLICYLTRLNAGKDRGHGESIHLHATDAESEWLLRLTPEGIEAEPVHGKADVALRGPVSDLYLWVLNRIQAAAAGLEVLGDAAVAARWREVARF